MNSDLGNYFSDSRYNSECNKTSIDVRTLNRHIIAATNNSRELQYSSGGATSWNGIMKLKQAAAVSGGRRLTSRGTQCVVVYFYRTKGSMGTIIAADILSILLPPLITRVYMHIDSI